MTIGLSELENGIRVVTEAMPGSRAVAIGILIDAGPRDETEDQAGLAHLVEHVLFHGTSSRNSSDIARIVDTMGGRVTAFTGRDYTCLSALVMDDHRTYALDLFADMLLNSIFPEDKLQKEKQVIINEQEMLADLPQEQVQSLLKSTIWPNHPLGRPIEGDVQTVASLSREDVIYFLHSNYLPDRMIIAFAGNLEHEDIVAQVRDCFWRLSGRSVARRFETATFRSGFSRHASSGSRATFAVGVEAPVYDSVERYGIHLLNTVLGGGMSSRLYRVLREERGHVYDIHSAYHAYVDGGVLVTSGSCRAAQVYDVVDEIIDVSGSLLSGTQPVREEELWQARLYNIGQYHIDSEDPFVRMSRLLTQLFYFKRVISRQEIVSGLEKTDPAALAEMCRDCFGTYTEKVAACVIGPDPREQAAK